MSDISSDGVPEKKFQNGDLVWAKMSKYPYWPGKTVNPEDYPEAGERNQEKFILVRFYGANNVAWIKLEMILDFESNKPKFEVNKKVNFRKALEEANKALDRKKKNLPEYSEEEASPSPKKKPAKKAKVNGGPLAKKSRVSSTEDNYDTNHDMTISSTQGMHRNKNINVVGDHVDQLLRMVHPSREDEGRHIAPDSSTSDYGIGGYVPTKIIATDKMIGFLGNGIFATPMIENLIKNGHKVTVWSKEPSSMKHLTKCGAQRGESPKDVVSKSDITFSCLVSAEEARDVVMGENSVLEAMCRGKGYIEMTTMKVQNVKELDSMITSKGGTFLEAPFHGSRKDAHEQKLIIMAGGDRSLYMDAHSCFETMGQKTWYLGQLGCAAATKLVMSMLSGTFMAALSEGFSLAEKAGLDQYTLLEVLGMSDISCPMLKVKGQAVLEGHFPANYPIKLQQQDMRIALDLGDELEQPLHMAGAANELYKRTKAMGYGDRDVACVYRAVNS